MQLKHRVNILWNCSIYKNYQVNNLVLRLKRPTNTDAYIACLSEIVRRRKYGKVFTQKIQAMGEELGALRENEMEHREEFLRTFGQHLPRDFVPGLAEKPSHCEFRMRPFDQVLLIYNEQVFKNW